MTPEAVQAMIEAEIQKVRAELLEKIANLKNQWEHQLRVAAQEKRMKK